MSREVFRARKGLAICCGRGWWGGGCVKRVVFRVENRLCFFRYRMYCAEGMIFFVFELLLRFDYFRSMTFQVALES